jgi:hypothetical protein
MNSLIPPLIDLLGLHQKDPLPMEQRMYHAKTTAWIGCIFALVFALFNMFIEAQMVLGLIELGVVVVLLVPAILASGSAHNIQRSEFLLLTATVVIFSALTVLGSIDGSGLFWVFAVPFVAFFLGGQRKGWWYSGSFFVTAVV